MQTITLEIEDSDYPEVLNILKKLAVRIKIAPNLESFIPNAETIEAMQEARLGQLEKADSIEQLIAAHKS
ncbi:MAG: hypothetical protein WAX77_09845 [Methylococcaceae bacterium]